MGEEVENWVALARRDLGVARLILNSELSEAAAMHVQQAAEKLLKALLTEAQVKAPRIHDLVKLSELLPVGAAPLASTALLERATFWLAEVRYGPVDEPGPSPNEVIGLLDLVEAYLTRRGW